METKIAGKYIVMRKIGHGAFGEIFQGINTKTFEEVAIKFESKSIKHPQLLYESKVYKHLQGGNGIANVYYYGEEGDYNVMVMDCLGQSLEDLFNLCKRKFSLKTVLMLAEQIFERVRFLHYKNIIHRDLKPDNFLIGTNKKQHLLHVIDFGLAKRYRDFQTGEHIPYRKGKSLTGTARYASIFTHLGEEQSRRDDLESIGFILIYFLKGSLPWQGIKAKDKLERYNKIKELKVNTTFENLCKGFPEEFFTYLKYCHNLAFTEKPDYDFIRKLFKDLFIKKGCENDNQYDWILFLKNGNISKIQSLFNETDLKQTTLDKKINNKEDKEKEDKKDN